MYATRASNIQTVVAMIIVIQSLPAIAAKPKQATQAGGLEAYVYPPETVAYLTGGMSTSPQFPSFRESQQQRSKRDTWRREGRSPREIQLMQAAEFIYYLYNEQGVDCLKDPYLRTHFPSLQKADDRYPHLLDLEDGKLAYNVWPTWKDSSRKSIVWFVFGIHKTTGTPIEPCFLQTTARGKDVRGEVSKFIKRIAESDAAAREEYRSLLGYWVDPSNRNQYFIDTEAGIIGRITKSRGEITESWDCGYDAKKRVFWFEEGAFSNAEKR